MIVVRTVFQAKFGKGGELAAQMAGGNQQLLRANSLKHDDCRRKRYSLVPIDFADQLCRMSRLKSFERKTNHSVRLVSSIHKAIYKNSAARIVRAAPRLILAFRICL